VRKLDLTDVEFFINLFFVVPILELMVWSERATKAIFILILIKICRINILLSVNLVPQIKI